MMRGKIQFRSALAQRPVRFGFIACNRNRHRFQEDPSFIYRCESLGRALQQAGHQVFFLHQSAVFSAPPLQVAVFHRPLHSMRLTAAMYWLRRRGCQLLADFDDLVFDETFAPYNPGVLNGLVSLKDVQRRYAAHRKALPHFDGITVSTEPLAAHVRVHVPQAQLQVLFNTVHCSWLDAPDEPPASAERPQVITYFPGTRSHDRDFSVFGEGIGAFLAENPESRLDITGPLCFQLGARPGQVVHRQKLPFHQYRERVRDGWLNLAPLEQTPFTRCKSALKVLEAAYYRVPTICSPIPDSLRFQGVGALFAEDAESCFKWLSAMREPESYRLASEGLRERALAVADVAKTTQQLLRFVGVGGHSYGDSVQADPALAEGCAGVSRE